MDARTRDTVARALGSPVTSTDSIPGGDINVAYRVQLEDGRHVFVKVNPGAARDMFPAEARGLSWLAEAGALRVPQVLAVSDPEGDEPAFLALELLEPGARRPDFDEALGRGLAALHRFGAPSFGLDHHNFIGRLPQDNTPAGDWVTFYRERRLEPQLRQATDRGLVSSRMREGFDRLLPRLDTLVGPAEPPARLHGDLWGGNLHVDDRGEPALIDPAVYGGHREMDLAMMRLFGGFGKGVFRAYDEAYPLAPGADERVPLYQLYPLMVHVNLFGSGYFRSVERALARLV
ncbi:MAG: fructosamine kinase family protein [Myxococcota bacterium]